MSDELPVPFRLLVGNLRTSPGGGLPVPGMPEAGIAHEQGESGIRCSSVRGCVLGRLDELDQYAAAILRVHEVDP